MADDQAGLLIAALVAIVAVVGLVILFSGQQANTGAFNMHFGGGISFVEGQPTQGGPGMCGCPEGYRATMQGRSGNLASCACHKLP